MLGGYPECVWWCGGYQPGGTARKNNCSRDSRIHLLVPSRQTWRLALSLRAFFFFKPIRKIGIRVPPGLSGRVVARIEGDNEFESDQAFKWKLLF